MRRAAADLARQPREVAPALRNEKSGRDASNQTQRIAEMQKSVKSKAEEKFAAIQKKDEQALSDREKARRKDAEHVAKLRALRLAKQAADKEAADLAEAAKAATKTKKKSSRAAKAN